MHTLDINKALAVGDIASSGVLPKVELLSKQPAVFRHSFGLDELPQEAGVLMIRGARQYGKSTWLQQQIKETIEAFGPGSAFYLNGDDIRNQYDLADEIEKLTGMFGVKAPVRRIFIDEITAVKTWEKALKRVIDRNETAGVLVVTTGSKAADLRHGAERLPGRKGRLNRTEYIFTPFSFAEFCRVCRTRFAETELLPAYLLSGGSPAAGICLFEHGRIDPYVIDIVRDWIYGEIGAAGRSRDMLLGIMDCFYRFGGSPVGYSKLAREAGMANNTVAAGYIEQLGDLMCVAPALAWDASHRRVNRRKPCKFHMTNLLAATAWHPGHIRCPADFHALSTHDQAVLLEWVVAQECWRRAAIRGDEIPDRFVFWQNEAHELDFVLSPDELIEVKRGQSGPFDFGWFPRTFPKANLTVVSSSRFDTDQIHGITLSDFLLSG